MIRLIIADDHPLMRDGIETILAEDQEIEVVGCVGDGTELLEMLDTIDADVILMDINMPGMNGIDATQQVRKKHPDLKVLVFSQYDEKRFVKQLMKNGANGYLLKNSAAQELMNAIKIVHSGGLFLSKELPNIFVEKPKKSSDQLFPKLTKREVEVLKQICLEKSTAEIAEMLFLSPNTVETHRANLLLKIGAKNTAGLVRWAIENEII